MTEVILKDTTSPIVVLSDTDTTSSIIAAAEAAADAAETEADRIAILAAIAGWGAGAGLVVPTTTRALLSALATTGPAYLSEAGREGEFVWSPSNLSAQVTVDTLQGVYVAPSSDVTGASGAWIRRFSGPLDIRWFGAVADCTAVGVGTDNAAAINAAVAVANLLGNGEVIIPKGRWRVASRLVFTNGIKITGEGHHENPGIANGVTYTGVFVYDGSVLVYDADVGGMIFYEFTDGANAATVAADLAANGAASVYWQYKSARFSVVRDLMLYGGGGTLVTPHGIEYRTVVEFENVKAINFAGSGFVCEASTGTLTTPYGNASISKLIRCVARANKLHGFRTRGYDANVISFDTCDSANNGGAGYLDDGFLGNKYENCHSAHNNASHGLATVWTTQAQTDSAVLTDANAGSYITSGTVATHTFNGCYTEGGLGAKAQIIHPSVVEGGNLNGDAVHTAGSTATRLGAINRFNGSSTGLVNVYASTGISLITVESGNSFANIAMKGAGLLANGLDILAGSGSSYFSSDNINFRNAAQSVTFGTFDTSGLNLPTGRVYKVNGSQVVGPRGSALPADATDLATALTLVNAIKARLKTTGGHGLVAD